jgi:hypothetical protein
MLVDASADAGGHDAANYRAGPGAQVATFADVADAAEAARR